MENLFYNISQVLGITIIHSLWQGLIIYIALRVFMQVFPAAPAAVKYRVAYSALAVTLGWFLYTLFNEMGHYAWLSTTALTIAPLTLPAVMHQLSGPANKYYVTISGYMPCLTMIYVVGLVFNTLKLSLAWNSIYRIRQNISDAGFDGTITRLSKKLNLAKTVQAVFSEWVDVPCITGFIKPMILLPFAITCYLSAEETEAILLHELAHIKRNDYLLNFIQQVMGILLFFNPFARLVNNLINEERENCCDDMVVQATGSPFIYAQALLKLEENKQQGWQLALAATGKKYELLNRIERIMKTKTQTINIRPVVITLVALACSISSIAWLNPEIKDGKVTLKNAEPAMRMISAAITAAAPVVVTHPVAATVTVPLQKKNLVAKVVTDSIGTADTAIKGKKYKIVVEDEQGNKKEYNSVNDLPAADKGAFIDDNAFNNSYSNYKMADSSHFMNMRKFVSGDVWKKQAEQMQKQAMAMSKKFNSPEWKKQVDDMAKHGAEMAKKFNSPEWKAQVEEMQKKGMDMAKYYDSPEGKKQIEAIAKQGEEIAKYYDSPEWKKQVEEMQKQGADVAKYYDSPEWKKQVAEIQKQGEEMSKYYNSPEWKAKVEDMQQEGGDLKIKLMSPEPRPAKMKEPVKMKTPKPAKPEKAPKPVTPETPEPEKPL